jgi:hypothetical protein
MVRSENCFKGMKLFSLVAIDLAVLLFGAALVVQDSRRWPVLLVIVPVLFVLSFFGILGIVGNQHRKSMVLPAIYGCGLVGGIYSALHEFAWWKCISIVVPLCLLIYSLKRSRSQKLVSES